jgi:hypothetical protein
MNAYDMESEREELEKYARLEGTEIGELCFALLHVANLLSCASEEFHAAVVKEIIVQLEMFKAQTKIVEREVTRTQKYNELEWIFE